MRARLANWVRRPGLWSVLGLAVLPFALFWREALGQRVYLHHDLIYYFLPYHTLVADFLKRGQAPLWNPYAFSGLPLLGDGQTAIFYPPNWLYLVLPPAHALTFGGVLHFAVAGVGAYLYVRVLGLGRPAALTAGVIFLGNGFLVARVVHPSIQAGAALIPLVFWGVEQLLRYQGLRGLVPAAGVVALQALTGHPQLPIYTALAVGGYVLVVALLHWWRGEGARAGWALGRLALAYGVGYGLAAVQLVPWVELARDSPRAAGASFALVTGESLVGPDWLLFFFPYAYGGPRTSWLQGLPPPSVVPVYLWERFAYVGLLPLALAGAGLAELMRLPRLRREQVAAGSALAAATWARWTRLWGLAAVLVVMLAIAAGAGTPVGRLVYALPAIGKLRGYSRAAGVAAFAVAILAAYGIERLAARRDDLGARRDRAAVCGGLLLLLGTGGSLLVVRLADAAWLRGTVREGYYAERLADALRLPRANAVVPAFLALASAATLWWLSRGLTTRRLLVALIVIAIDLGGVAVTFNSTSDPALLAATPRSVAFLREDQSPYRIASFVTSDRLPVVAGQDALAMSWALVYGIEDINGFNSLQPRRYTDFLFGPAVEDVSYGLLRDQTLLEPENRVLALLDVRYALLPAGAAVRPESGWTRVFTDRQVTIYRNPVDYGRAYFVARVEPVTDPRAVLAAVRAPGFDPRARALVEGGDEALWRQLAVDPAPVSATDRVTVNRPAANEVRLVTATTATHFLVLSEMWFPGWHAEVDGRATPLYRTNYLFRGLVVPAGDHVVRLYYRPASAFVGGAITLLTALALGGARGVARWRQGGGSSVTA